MRDEREIRNTIPKTATKTVPQSGTVFVYTSLISHISSLVWEGVCRPAAIASFDEGAFGDHSEKFALNSFLAITGDALRNVFYGE